MGQLKFQYPQALWLLAAVPLLVLMFVFYLAWRRKTAKKIGSIQLVKGLQKGHSPLKAAVKFALLVLAFAAGCVALANPRKPAIGGTEARKGLDVVLALDVSNSMLAADATGRTRLVAAKEFITKLVAAMPENRFALVLFAGQAYVQTPLTYDHSATQLFVASANPSSITAQGTGVTEALQKSEAVFAEDLDRYKAVILITDGETHDEGAPEAISQMTLKGVMVHTVGIGSAAGAAIIDPVTREVKKDAEGNIVLSKLNEPLLQQLATASKGVYINLKGAGSAVAQLVSEFSGVEKKALVDTSLLNYETFYAWLAAPMLFFLLAEIFLPDRKKKRA